MFFLNFSSFLGLKCCELFNETHKTHQAGWLCVDGLLHFVQTVPLKPIMGLSNYLPKPLISQTCEWGSKAVTSLRHFQSIGRHWSRDFCQTNKAPTLSFWNNVLILFIRALELQLQTAHHLTPAKSKVLISSTGRVFFLICCMETFRPVLSPQILFYCRHCRPGEGSWRWWQRGHRLPLTKEQLHSKVKATNPDQN